MKKIPISLTTLSFVALPAYNIISCSKPTIDPDYYIPSLSQQPKNIQEIEKEALRIEDLFEDYLEIGDKKWEKYKMKVDFWNLNEAEQIEHQLAFNLNSLESQKQQIFSFWMITYNYKVYQFDQTYNKFLLTLKGRKLHLQAYDLEDLTSFKDIWLNDKFLTNETKSHIEKIYEWGIQDNPNAFIKN